VGNHGIMSLGLRARWIFYLVQQQDAFLCKFNERVLHRSDKTIICDASMAIISKNIFCLSLVCV
jgi:hypothetical protein